jgi:hypothetical protein
MPLSASQIKALEHAISCYGFPAAYYDFSTNHAIPNLTMGQVESRIRTALLSGSLQGICDGFSNVLYWGYAQMGGLSGIRADRFRNAVTPQKLRAAVNLFKDNPRPTLLDIAALKLPEFSAVSFVSKVRMFLSPKDSATLDKQLLKIKFELTGTVLDKVVVSTADTAIRVTQANSIAYEHWCNRLGCIRGSYFPKTRVVDIERGFFRLVQIGKIRLAAEILRDA